LTRKTEETSVRQCKQLFTSYFSIVNEVLINQQPLLQKHYSLKKQYHQVNTQFTIFTFVFFVRYQFLEKIYQT